MRTVLSPRRRVIGALCGLLFLLVVPARPGAATAQNSPLETTRQFIDQALRILANKQTPVARRQTELRELIAPRFDFTEMSRSALGYHWKSLTADQRTAFTQTFTSFIQSAYLSKIGDYSGQRVEVLKQDSLGDGYSQVFTRIIQPGKEPIPVNYLLERKDNDWKVYDVTVDNISIIANYRTQFNRVMNDQGFDKLLADLKAKQQQIASSSKAG